jgi:predicted dehydrogenase
MKDGLRINGENHSSLYINNIQTDGKGVAFFEGKTEEAPVLEMRMWVDASVNDKEPVVTPEQACVVSEILEAIYESAKTGKAIYFD